MIEIKRLTKEFEVEAGFFNNKVLYIKALRDVSFDIKKGEALGLVGESGCGKSTLGKLIVRLLDPTSGEIYFEGKNIFGIDPNEFRKCRKNFQIIFQDPYASLNPRMCVGNIVMEPMVIHRLYKTRSEYISKVLELMEIVGLSSAVYRRYPHEFSGGQRQRIGIARALSLTPKFIVADEPVSSLDVCIQAQIVNLLMDLKSRFQLTYLFISHDLRVIRQVSDRVAVMYLGKIVELASNNSIYKEPLHPYTTALLSAAPILGAKVSRTPLILEGEVPSPINPPRGCSFHPRCNRQITSECKNVEPQLREVIPGHYVACHLV